MKVASHTFAALQVLAVIALIALLAMALHYLAFSSFYDHGEAAVAALSEMLFASGQPLYHGPEAATRYSISYGPLLYLLVGLPGVALGSSIVALKVTSVVACMLSVFLLYRAVCRHCASTVALALVGLFALSLLLFENYAYWVRPDPFLVLCVAFGVSQAATARLRAAAVSAGLSTGIAINLKLHGAVYMLPVFALLLLRRPALPDMLLAFAAASVAAAAPFLLPQISLADYLSSMTIAPRHGLSLAQLIESITYLLLLLAPLIGIALLASERVCTREIILPAAALAAALLVTTVISGKRGAGPHHFLPFLPAIVYLCAALLKGQHRDALLARISERKSAAAGFLLVSASCLVLAALALQSQLSVLAALSQDGEAQEAAQELRQLLRDYPDASVQMGYTDRGAYRLSHLRALIAARGDPYWLDAVALMDYDAAGITLSAASLEMVENCTTQVWILPTAGKPFSLVNYYATGRNIFGEDFVRVFARRYTHTRSTRHFSAWECRPDQG